MVSSVIGTDWWDIFLVWLKSKEFSSQRGSTIIPEKHYEAIRIWHAFTVQSQWMRGNQWHSCQIPVRFFCFAAQVMPIRLEWHFISNATRARTFLVSLISLIWDRGLSAYWLRNFDKKVIREQRRNLSARCWSAGKSVQAYSQSRSRANLNEGAIWPRGQGSEGKHYKIWTWNQWVMLCWKITLLNKDRGRKKTTLSKDFLCVF